LDRLHRGSLDYEGEGNLTNEGEYSYTCIHYSYAGDSTPLSMNVNGDGILFPEECPGGYYLSFVRFSGYVRLIYREVIK
jgi:hypothetical protein